MNSQDRFYGWAFDESTRDRFLLGIYQEYRENKSNFADHVKDVLYQYHTGELVRANATIQQLEDKIDDIRAMLKSGKLLVAAADDNGVVDDELMGILGDMGT